MMIYVNKLSILAALTLSSLLPAIKAEKGGGCLKHGEYCGNLFGKPCCGECMDHVINPYPVCAGDGRRNLRTVSDQKAEVRQLHEQECTNTQYELSLKANNGHLMLLAQPVQGSDESCRSFIAHDSSNSDKRDGKQIKFAMSENQQASFDDEWKSTFPVVGDQLYTYKELSQAFDGSDSLLNKEYDVMDSNCATFILSFLKQLEIGYQDIQQNNALIDYVVDSLADSHIPNYVRQSPNVQNMFHSMSIDNAASLDDNAVTGMLVRHYLKEFYSL